MHQLLYSGKDIVTLYTAPNPFLLKKICLESPGSSCTQYVLVESYNYKGGTNIYFASASSSLRLIFIELPMGLVGNYHDSSCTYTEHVEKLEPLMGYGSTLHFDSLLLLRLYNVIWCCVSGDIKHSEHVEQKWPCSGWWFCQLWPFVLNS